jgi:hypothetical protein
MMSDLSVDAHDAVVSEGHPVSQATTEVHIMFLVRYTKICAARDKIDDDATKSR